MTPAPAPESVVLPKSGLVLRPTPVPSYDWLSTDASERIAFRRKSAMRPAKARLFDRERIADSDDEALAWLDVNVLATRAALLPADLRERVAEAIENERARNPLWSSNSLTTAVLRLLSLAPEEPR